ncbi:carbamoyl phosphate synthase small subunit [Lentibacillus amyloliquefaciens]|uniref:Carbamoyl phosphate synthase small chain n=1 Tax=Lentibacillus amyloliquefaciens TaxID=1472767 RepID=A0A0U4E2B1_9BACI|nr:carbamoyl phosphate synthase small subunit [Lentibacillus amyloliquefaciens]ALX47404.1 carbamoyl-phosphate synthase small subunit [Lentibacillus amyloliquefaciens]
MTKRQLVLEDGTIFTGDGFGAETKSTGEIVFNTGMTGYQEVITDPSYCGQIVTMTYPLIGNYGINRDDFETVTPFIHGIVVKELSGHPSNFRSDETLHDYLKANDIPGISGIDTRQLTKSIRNHGTMKAMMTDADKPSEELIDMVKNLPDKTDQVKTVSTVKPYVVPGRGRRIVLVDLGMKHSILRELTKRDCHVTVVPYDYGAENILRLKPDGIMLTNGPGNPKHVPEMVAMVKSVLGKIPLFGICLGHQLLALACGADTEKMAFGHRGANHPVKDLEKNKTVMTAQNHSYVVIHDSLSGTDLVITQESLNDHSVEGIRHKTYPAFSVQYHPESSPGPEDTPYLFDEFLQMISESREKENVYA